MQDRITQAIILSAGLGTRLRPLTENVPKVMIPILGKPLLGHHIEQFKRYGVDDFFVNLHYLPDVIKNYLGDGSKHGIRVTYSFEPTPMETAGGIKNFERDLNDIFFVIYGDVFSMVDYSKMAEAFYKEEDAIGMCIIGDTDHPHDSDLVEVDDNLRFLKIHPKPHNELPANYYSMRGCYIFRKDILSFIPKNEHYKIDHQLLPDIIAMGKKFYGYKTDDYLMDVGTPERYTKVQEYLKSADIA